MTNPPQMGWPEPDAPPPESWTDADWERWFNEEVAQTDLWSRFNISAEAYRDIGRSAVKAVRNAPKWYTSVTQMTEDIATSLRPSHWLEDSGSRTPAQVFSHQLPEDRTAFHEGWSMMTKHNAKFEDADWEASERPHTVTLDNGIVMVLQPDGTFAPAEPVEILHTMPGTDGGTFLPPVDARDQDGDGYVDGTDLSLEDADDSAVQDAAGSNEFGNRTMNTWVRTHVPAVVGLTAMAVFAGGIAVYVSLSGSPEPSMSEGAEPAVAAAVSEPEDTVEEVTVEEVAVEELVEVLVEEPLEVVHDCPDDHQPDTTGIWVSRKDGEQPESASNTPRDEAADIDCSYTWSGSYGFTMTVKGDGESLSKAEYTSYQVRFVVNNDLTTSEYYDDTGFSVSASWQHRGQGYAGQVLNADLFNPQPIEGAKVDIEWLDESTFQVIVDLPGDPIEVTEVRTELNVYITDADGNYEYDRFDVAIWKAEP